MNFNFDFDVVCIAVVAIFALSGMKSCGVTKMQTECFEKTQQQGCFK